MSCPHCNREADQYFVRDGTVLGCEYCIESAWSDELYPENGIDEHYDDLYHAAKDEYYEVEI